jgi:2-keto-4-pentenoate hydratase/2-oxohepta-3-ene-1,7-dioic acid hydratase in catechol pathway
MKLITFERDGRRRVGALVASSHVVDLTSAFADTLSLIEGGSEALRLAQSLVNKPPESARYPLDAVRILAPLPRPVQMRDFANYELHVRQALASSMAMRAEREQDPENALERLRRSGAYQIPPVWYEMPLYYKCNRMSVVGTDTDVIWPRYAEVLDYELELGAVIGQIAKDVSASEARSYIFGYTIYNDFSARDMQVKESQFRMGPAKGKDFDTGNAIGPCIVTADELTDPYNLTMIVRVNGEERGRGRSGDMQHSFERCIEHVSMSETIYPGEILMAGTVGNGSGFERRRFLSPGDVVELEVEGIGILRNRVVKRV